MVQKLDQLWSREWTRQDVGGFQQPEVLQILGILINKHEKSAYVLGQRSCHQCQWTKLAIHCHLQQMQGL
jgi:hypothetical protein